jgi:hypothetical protein
MRSRNKLRLRLPGSSLGFLSPRRPVVPVWRGADSELKCCTGRQRRARGYRDADGGSHPGAIELLQALMNHSRIDPGSTCGR